MQPRIILENVIKIYKTGKIEVVALKGITLTINPGEIIVIMGPSGCGKSTLLNMIGGLDLPTAGKVVIDGVNIAPFSESQLDTYRRQRIGFIFQFLNLIPTLSAEENIKLALLHSPLSKSAQKARIEELLTLIGLTARRHQKPDTLSGGEQQRIAIASAIANDPPILLADEPTGELDSANQREILALFEVLIKKDPSRVLIIVTHDARMQAIASRVLYIRDGEIIFEKKGGEINMSEREMGTGLDSSQLLSLSTEMDRLRKESDLLHEVKGQIQKIYEKIQPVPDGPASPVPLESNASPGPSKEKKNPSPSH